MTKRRRPALDQISAPKASLTLPHVARLAAGRPRRPRDAARSAVYSAVLPVADGLLGQNYTMLHPAKAMPQGIGDSHSRRTGRRQAVPSTTSPPMISKAAAARCGGTQCLRASRSRVRPGVCSWPRAFCITDAEPLGCHIDGTSPGPSAEIVAGTFAFFDQNQLGF